MQKKKRKELKKANIRRLIWLKEGFRRSNELRGLKCYYKWDIRWIFV